MKKTLQRNVPLLTSIGKIIVTIKITNCIN